MAKGVPAPGVVCTRCHRAAREHEFNKRMRARVCDDGVAFVSPAKRESKSTSAGQSFTQGQADLFAAIMTALPSQPSMVAYVRNPHFVALARKAQTTKASAARRVAAAEAKRLTVSASERAA